MSSIPATTGLSEGLTLPMREPEEPVAYPLRLRSAAVPLIPLSPLSLKFRDFPPSKFPFFPSQFFCFEFDLTRLSEIVQAAIEKFNFSANFRLIFSLSVFLWIYFARWIGLFAGFGLD